VLRVAAADLGATSIRVSVVDLDRRPAEVEVVHRFAHQPRHHGDGSLRWEWDRLMVELEAGLDRAVAAGPLASIGIDAWGVDYGLVDRAGRLLSAPYSYRDTRTQGWEATADALGREHLYRRTGIQLMPINTVFQLAAHPRSELDSAHRLVMLADLAVHRLTGELHCEHTAAATSGLLEAGRPRWAADLLEALELRSDLFLAPERPGTPAGRWRGVPVHLVGGHDTASAVACVPAGAGTGFVASGSWMLVGVRLGAPDLSPAAYRANFSNEVAVDGGVRLLRNVPGLWLLEECRRAWGDPPLDDLLAGAAGAAAPGRFDPRLFMGAAPPDMEAAVREAAGLGGAERYVVTRCILESVAAGVGAVVADLAGLGHHLSELVLVGGGARMELLRRLVAEAAGLPVRVGAAEATCLGNAAVQGVALGRYRDLAEAAQEQGP